MNTIRAIFVYTALLNVCVVARGHGGHGGSHGGHSSHSGHSSHGYGSHGYGSHGYHHVSSSHTHYTYHPPSHITYSCRSCSSSGSYPVYGHPPPTYVYVYKDSGSRYNQLLTGLSLYNLGRSSGGSHYSSYSSHHNYAATPNEICSLQIISKSHFEETEIPCFIISSFIETTPTNNTRSVDITNTAIDVKPYVSDTRAPLEVTEDQECVLWHNMTMYKERNVVPCELLKQYANTVKVQSGVPVYIWLPTLLGAIIIIYLCCYLCCKKKKESVKEEAPLNDLPVVGYCANY